MSPRHFARLFSREVSVTPAKYVERTRIDVAREQLKTTNLNIENIAKRCGFTHSEIMRRCFLRHLNISPRAYRERFKTIQTNVI